MVESDALTFDSEEVRRSLDVLDKVLSEFDDIGSNEDFYDVEENIKQVDVKNGEEQFSAPPVIDRRLKPQETPPALPKKERKDRLLQQEKNEVGQNESSPVDSLKRSTSETSSHEYQEINSDLIDSSRRSKSLTRNANNETLFRPVKQIESNSNLKQHKISKDGNRGRSKLKESALHKSKSRDNIPCDSKLSRENIQKRKAAQRRSKSSERVLNQRKKPSQSFSHPLGNKQAEFYHQPQFDQIPLDPRLLDPRILNTIPLDPRLRHKVDQMLLSEPIPYIPPFNSMDGGSYLTEDQIPFPHLIHNANIPLGMVPPIEMPYYPEHLPSDMLDPNFSPHMIPNGYLPMDPMDFGYQYPYHLENMEQGFVPRNGIYPPEYPFDMPLEYYGIDPMNYPFTNEKFGYPIQRMPPYLDKNVPVHEMERMWIASQQEQIALNNLRNLQHMTADNVRNGHGERMQDMNAMNINRMNYPGGMSGMDRTDVRKSLQRNKLRKSSSRGFPVAESLSSETSFRVGEAVNCQDEVEEIMSPTNFISGGKDSGFDESPPIEDLTNRDGKSPHPGTGSGFIVSGVFNDSSKMYIPAPPSPTPDYDEKCSDSDGGESDILQSSLYHIKSKRERKTPKYKDDNCDSLSDDSLQDTTVCLKKEEKTKSLQTMINEFHNGLPAPVPESYSDDSLDGSSASPSHPSSVGIKSRRIMSMESLTSIDGSTTSFDYVKAGSSKSIAKNKQNMKRHSSYFSEKMVPVLPSNEKNVTRRKSDPKKVSSEKQGKFDTIRNLIKEGLLEGLDEQPPSFKPPPTNKGTLEKNDSGVSSRASTTKTIESVDSSSKSSNSSFSDNALNKTGGMKKLKAKDPAPQPPMADLPSRPNSRSPNNHSWLHKQKRQAPVPNEMASKLQQGTNKEKITHVDEILSSTSRQTEYNKSSGVVSRYRPLTDDNKVTIEKCSSNTLKELNASTSNDSLDSRINHPTFSGPLVSSEMQSSQVSESKKPAKHNSRNTKAVVSMLSEKSQIRETIEKDGNGKQRKTIEINSSPLNYAISKYSDKDTKGRQQHDIAYTSQKKIFQDPKPSSNSSWSPKYSEDSSKSRFNIFKGFWRRNKYSFDKF